MKTTYYLFLAGLTLLLTPACQNSAADSAEAETEEGPRLSVSVREWGPTDAGTAQLYTLTNQNGMEVDITNYGGIVTRVLAPDRDSQLLDVVLGFEERSDYETNSPYLGAVIGRFGNRIAAGKFRIDDEAYQLGINNDPNALHGGPTGFHVRLWQSDSIVRPDAVGVELTRLSPDGEEGYPGNLNTTVRYLLNNDNELRIEYEATTDQPTIVNLTNHTYFNLRGAGNGDILGHELMIDADSFTPVDNTLIPTGELRPVEGTPFDFRQPTPIGARIDADNEQIRFGLGYDHNFVLDRDGPGLERIATVYEPTSGRYLEVLTTEPGVQFYSGNFLDGTLTGKGGTPLDYRTGFCLETQHYPDSPNQPEFPSTVLRPGETYESTTVYRFSAKE
jgi:aldose 1-epimerase